MQLDLVLVGASAWRVAGLFRSLHTHRFLIWFCLIISIIIMREREVVVGGTTICFGHRPNGNVLEDLATLHDFPARVLDYRQLSKLKSTYTDALQEHINGETGRVHTSYSIAGASTGRLASTDPNLQNIPVRTEEGRRIRHIVAGLFERHASGLEDKDIINADGIEEISTMLRRMERYWTDQIRYIY